jgi:putative transposase
MIKFGLLAARWVKRRRSDASPRWHLHEMACSISGKRRYLWRAVADEGWFLTIPSAIYNPFNTSMPSD